MLREVMRQRMSYHSSYLTIYEEFQLVLRERKQLVRCGRETTKRTTTRAETGMLYDIEQIIQKNTTKKMCVP